MKTVLVTGANGFTGRHFIDYVKGLNHGLNIIGIDVKEERFNSSRRFKFIKLDLLDKGKLQGIIAKVCPDYVFHFAGINFSGNYKILLESNVLATSNLLEAVLNNKHKHQPRMLIVGSSAEYGVVPLNKQPIPESSALRPVTFYGVTKASQGLLALQYHFRYGLHIVLARPFNIIGPGQSSGFICGSIVEQIKNIKKNKTRGLTVGNISTSRDFVDIRDVVRAYWMLLAAKKNISGEAFNIGSGKAYSIKLVLDTLLGYSELKVKIKQKRQMIRVNDVPYQKADISKIKKTINWKPEISITTSLKDMLQA